VIAEDNNRVTGCDFRDTSDNCLFHFTSEYDEDNNVIIKIQKTKGGSWVLYAFRGIEEKEEVELPFYIYSLILQSTGLIWPTVEKEFDVLHNGCFQNAQKR
jgi:uncharacterized Zn finger protein